MNFILLFTGMILNLAHAQPQSQSIYFQMIQKLESKKAHAKNPAEVAIEQSLIDLYKKLPAANPNDVSTLTGRLRLVWQSYAALSPEFKKEADEALAKLSPVPITPVVAPAASMPIVPSLAAVESMLNEDVIRALRDPFQVPTILSKKENPKTDLELYALKDFKLSGVITGPKKLRAMVIAPNNKTYFLAIGDHIGVREGKVTAIKADTIKIVEYELDEHGKRIPEMFEMQLNGELVSLSQKEE